MKDTFFDCSRFFSPKKKKVYVNYNFYIYETLILLENINTPLTDIIRSQSRWVPNTNNEEKA